MSDMDNDSSTYPEDFLYQNVTLIPTSAGTSFIANKSDSTFIIITVSTLAFAIISVTIVYFLAKKLSNVCCLPSLQKTASESYTTVPSEETSRNINCNYGSQLSRQSELSHVIDIPSNTPSLWNDSEYDNLSLNTAVHDSELIDTPPEYEHPPPYESPRLTRVSKNHLEV